MTNTESWNGILKTYLKADDFPEHTGTVVCVDVVVDGESMDLEVEKEQKKYTFSLNVTNKVFLKNNGITRPKDVIGKTITLEKVKAMNPTLRKEVDSLRIIRVE